MQTEKDLEKKKKNLPIALNILYAKEMKICPAYISKINLNSKKQKILLIIPTEEKMFALSCCKKAMALLITWKHHGDFYCFNCLLQQKTNLHLTKKYVKIKIFVELIFQPKQNILEFNQSCN